MMNDGFINEEELREYINNNSFGDYNKNIQDFLRFTFGENLNTNLPFKAQKITKRVKPDLCVIHNGIEKYISVKKGSGNSVHQESIEVFFPFVENMFGLETLNNLKLFHYGDDTIDDSGETRYCASECQTRYAGRIADLNSKLNNWSNLLKFLDRFLFVGNLEALSVDVIYYGTISSGLWAYKDEIINYIHDNDFSSKTLHFGPLTYQVWGRNEKRAAVHPERRYVMQIKWGSIKKDLEAIRTNYTSS